METKRKLPAYPLFLKDPNFSLWCVTDELNDGTIEAWYGEKKPVYGFLKVNGETYCFLGDSRDFQVCGVKRAEQVSLYVTAFTTDYVFKAGDAVLKLRFVSPLPPDDLMLLSMPVCYMEYEIEGANEGEISLFVNRAVCYNSSNPQKGVRGGVLALNGFESAVLGLKRQQFLSNNDDRIGADWGYYYLAGEQAFITDQTDLAAYLARGSKEFTAVGEERYLCAVNSAAKGIIMLGYDDIVSIDYFGDFRKGYFLQDHTITEALETVWYGYREIDRQLAGFDASMKEKSLAYGEGYYDVLTASLRQSVAAHKLIKDGDGNVIFLSKECGSNGCIATVDVSYPSIPLYLLYNTELVKGMMRPILKVAHTPCWTYDFAPHDAGTYPHCCGNVYGQNNRTKNKYLGNLLKDGAPETHFPYYLLPKGYALFLDEMQMPVEECANMLVMFAACYRLDGDISFFTENRTLCARWVKYLVNYGLKPENQLCTDDFAGHLKNNLNLAVKSVVGIGAYAQLMSAVGDASAAKYMEIAKKYADEITAFSGKFSHMPLTWDSGEQTFSLKYNFAFDRILGLRLFPQDLLEREVDYYVQIANAYGTPLDSRKVYTKSDWICWSASLTDDKQKAQKLLAPIVRFLYMSVDRLPFGDWFDTDGQGKSHDFRARSVQGGCFILLL